MATSKFQKLFAIISSFYKLAKSVKQFLAISSKFCRSFIDFNTAKKYRSNHKIHKGFFATYKKVKPNEKHKEKLDELFGIEPSKERIIKRALEIKMK